MSSGSDVLTGVKRLNEAPARVGQRWKYSSAKRQKLEGVEDKYNGVQISADKLPQDRALFSNLLEHSLEVEIASLPQESAR